MGWIARVATKVSGLLDAVGENRTTPLSTEEATAIHKIVMASADEEFKQEYKGALTGRGGVRTASWNGTAIPQDVLKPLLKYMSRGKLEARNLVDQFEPGEPLLIELRVLADAVPRAALIATGQATSPTGGMSRG